MPRHPIIRQAASSHLDMQRRPIILHAASAHQDMLRQPPVERSWDICVLRGGALFVCIIFVNCFNEYPLLIYAQVLASHLKCIWLTY